MQTVSVQCHAPAGSMDAILLNIAVALSGLDRSVVTFADATSSDTCSVGKTTTNAFSGRTNSSTSVGLTGSLRLLLASTEMDLTSTQVAAVESWWQAVDQTLLPIVRLEKKDPIFQAAVEDFMERIETYLLLNHQTVLVGDYATSADAITAVALAGTCHSLQLTTLPQQVYRWCVSTVQRLCDALTATSDAASVRESLQTWVKPLQQGKASPLELPPTPPPAVIAATPAAAPAAAATPAPAAATPSPAATTTTAEEPSSSTPPEWDTSITASDNAVLQTLQSLGIPHVAYNHVPCDTAEQLVANVPLPDPATHTHTKNLFLRDKKHGIFLVTVRPNAAVNTKVLGSDQLKLPGKTNLRLADAEILAQMLHVKPGCVGPLAVLPDGIAVKKTSDKAEESKEKITLVMDRALVEQYQTIHSHPLRNDMSVQLSAAALKDALAKRNIEPVWLTFEDAVPTDMAGGKAPANRPPASKTPAPAAAPKKKKESTEGGGAAAAGPSNKKTNKKGETLLALQWKKAENFPYWYTDVIVLSEMISYYEISGCYILRPWSYKIWELIQDWFNARIQQDMGVENAYFPLFVSKNRLEREKDHVEGFAPEVAWVTKSGDGDLENPIAIRPTSETIMYPAYSDWIRSHRDLPLKLNQWSNVVRWEFKYPTPFLRTREFLWQEGHTAHSTFEDANGTVMQALDLYRRVYEDLLAVPVIPGYKTEAEKFAGGYRTTTVEAYIAGSGRAIQGATSHHLGQNFGKMFDITFQDEKGTTQTAWQTSWGLTTRTIGVMVMVHGDDTGLVLPPRVAPLQVVIVPILSKNLTAEQAGPYCQDLLRQLQAAGMRAKYDDRDMYNPGWKYNHWEQKGVPIRIEVGPRDMENKSVRVVVRHNGAKADYPIEGLAQRLLTELDEIQNAMFVKAKEARDQHIVQVTEWKDFVPNLEKNNLVLTPWCGGEHSDWEKWVKETSREESLKARGEEAEDDKTSTSVAAKTLCIPFTQPDLPAGTKCIASGMDATCWVLWGRSY